MSNAENSATDSYMLGGYEIVATAGAGGMGVVYKGVDPALDRTVAIKVLKDELRAHPAVLARFRREAEAIATLNHPNIVRIFAIGDSDALPYIVMEFVEGQPLSETLTETGSLPWEEALDIGIQVADALVCAHDCQIIHRDIKPANILITEDGTVKVTDFGIAKVLNASTQLTVDGARIGTPQYMCPERCKNLPATHSSDLYSLGVMLFQSITGRLPYDAVNAAELIGKIAYEVPKRIREFKPDVPEPVDRLVAYMLEKEAENRPPDASTLRKMIARIRRGETLVDELPALDVALESIRSETPIPQQPSSTTLDRSTPWRERIQIRWYAMPKVARVLLGLATTALIGFSGYFLIQQHAQSASTIATESALIRDDVRRWTEHLSLAEFHPETEGVTVGTLGLSDFRIAQLDWIDGADGAIARLEGIPGSPRAGQMTLLTINPSLKQVNISIPPMHEGTEPILTLLGTGQYRDGSPGMILSAATGTFFLGTNPGATPHALAPWPSQAALFSDQTGSVILSRNAADANTRSPLLAMDGESGGGQGAEFSIHGSIRQLAAHADTGQVAVLSQTDATMTLSVAMAAYPNEAAEVIQEGTLALSKRPFSPTGGKLVFLEYTDSGEGQAVVQSRYNRQDTVKLGVAHAAQWLPASDDLILMAPDHAGRHQLWKVSSHDRASRQQLTFLETGLGNAVAVSDDGHYVMATRPDSNAFVIVDVPLAAPSSP